MSLTRFYYDPITSLDLLSDGDFNARFRPISSEAARRTQRFSSKFRPRMDLQASKDSNTVKATFELPGLMTDEIKINLEHNHLTISGESSTDHCSEQQQQQPEGGFVIRERRYGKFSRTLQLPFGTKPEDVKAKMENGVLSVTFPKAALEQQPRRIAIQ